MSVKNYKLICDRYIVITDTITNEILLNQPIDATHFSRDTIISMIRDLVDDIIFFNSHGLTIKVGYKNT